MKGGTWKEDEKSKQQINAVAPTNRTGDDEKAFNVNGFFESKPQTEKTRSILDEIFEHRQNAVHAQKQVSSQRPLDLQSSYNLNLSPPQVSFPERLRMSPYSLSLMAEIKRASPSKGDIAPRICAPEQARKYALAGASVISVLTEPKWFKGSIDDLRAVRQSLEGMPNRPAVLRKEFVFDEYQILEGRIAGCDTVLLIVKMLSENLLRKLYLYSQSLGMEPLVEVNTVDEMAIALNLGAKVIGVNNRNLTNFEVDLGTTSRLMEGVPTETVVCALSGISGPNDVQAYRHNGVGAVLVGEALMRAENTATFVDQLLGGSQKAHSDVRKSEILVKICGTRTVEAAKVAIEAGADMVGIILVEGRKRCVSTENALAISAMTHGHAKPKGDINVRLNSEQTTNFFPHTTNFFRRPDRALLVGVFQNQPLSYTLTQQKLLDLDVVQLHGSEPIEWASLIPVPVIRRFGPRDPGLGRRGYHALPLLDSAAGGTGERQDSMAIKSLLDSDDGLRVVLAGGLHPGNVADVLSGLSESASKVVAVDVSSGVEESGVQSHEKIKQFVNAAKSVVKDC